MRAKRGTQEDRRIFRATYIPSTETRRWIVEGQRNEARLIEWRERSNLREVRGHA